MSKKASVTKTLLVSGLLLSGGIGLALAQDDPSFFTAAKQDDVVDDYDPDFDDQAADYADYGDDGDAGDFGSGQCESFDWTDGRHGMDISTHALSDPYDPTYDYDGDLCELIDDLSNQGVRVLAINAAYSDGDNGYAENESFDGWGNLVIDDLDIPNAKFNYDWGEFGRVMQCAHDRCMKVVSWWNPSYVLPSSSLYQDHPEYYRWGDDDQCQSARDNGCKFSVENQLEVPGCEGADSKACGCEWVIDGDRDDPDSGSSVCYASVWGGAPSGDFAYNDDWSSMMVDKMNTFIDNGLDGFVLDAPNMYVGIGRFADPYDEYGPDGDTLYQKLVQPLKERNPQVLILGETYNFPLFQRTAGLDGDYTEYENTDLARPNALNEVIEGQDPYAFENYQIFDGQDKTATHCRIGSWLNDERDYYCPMNMVRLLSSLDAARTGTNKLARVLSTAAGSLTDTYMNVEDGKESNWWTPVIPSDGSSYDQETNDFLTYAAWGSDDGDAGAWTPAALRAPVPYYDDQVYTMLKYDAFDSGAVGLFAANLGDDGTSSDLYPGNALYTDTLGSYVGSDQVDSTTVDGQHFAYVDFPSPLATWSIADNTYPGGTNCFDDDSFPILRNPDTPDDTEMTFGECLLRCLGTEEWSCNMVVVEWDEWSDAGLVKSCWGNTKSAEDLNSAGSCYYCDSDSGENCAYTTLSHSWADTE